MMRPEQSIRVSKGLVERRRFIWKTGLG